MPGSIWARFAGSTLLVVVAMTFAGAWGRGDSPEGKGDSAEGPRYAADGRLLRPRDYREWVYVTSGLGMTYGPAEAAEGEEPRFDNVFVTRPAYREFLDSGTWPDGTMFILEVREARANVSINNGGRTQGDVLALEAAVKDRGRFPEGGWGYYSFDGPDGPLDSATALPTTASCYSCHRDKAAVDNTFVQFYPTLLDVARRHGTVGLEDGSSYQP
jgi:hypothetical protein